MILKENVIKIKINGKSHSKKISLELHNFPKTNINYEEIKKELKKRNPKFFFNTQRNEEDEFEIVKNNDKLIKIVFKNKDANKKPYIQNEGFLRPNQSDYAQYLKYNKRESGGGEFSGRMTLPIVFAGMIAKQKLKEKNILIHSQIKRIGKLEDKEIDFSKNQKAIDELFPVSSKEFKKQVFDYLKNIQKENDSVGGMIETTILNVCPGLGGAYFNRLESELSKAIFSIPSIKGVEFGEGVEFAFKKGSEVQDVFILENDIVKTKTNHCGGINGGVSNGMPIIIKSSFKPVPTIKKEMTSLNYLTKKDEKVIFKGNHDCFIGNRIIPAIEGMIAIALLDRILYENKKQN